MKLTQQSVIGLVATVIVLNLPASVLAASFSWSYLNQTGDLYTGIMEGIVQTDGNTIEISKVENTRVNGNLLPATPFVFPALLSSLVPIISFDGTVMDIIACQDAGCNEGFLFAPQSPPALTPIEFATSPAYDTGGTGFTETFSPAFWQLQSTPESTSILGIVLMGTIGRLFVRHKEI